ncbi:SET domain-containing protein SmydA-8-like [Tigriopus californicus]|uniref:SET domain-containing protein SmydA-8-like n=1 Tax=Tigriopus californicus TaxID=6832 RepID=UPI0027DA9F02|nr:SET domain-containing protein SmydA-8-like [Tigriopus californicus]
MSNPKMCFMCLQPAKLRCEECEADIWYCGHTHGNYHRLDGSSQCSPVMISFQEGIGRCLLASRNIIAGEVIFFEHPIVVGPNNVTAPQCLICNSKITETEIVCSCNYPMCSKICQDLHEGKRECQILGDIKLDLNYELILPLRLLLTQDQDHRAFLGTLMNHVEEKQQNKENWMHLKHSVIEPLVQAFQGTISEIAVTEALGVVEVNNYEIYNPLDCGYRGIFPMTSLMTHSCAPNSRHAMEKKSPWSNRCIATVDIPKGQDITTTYVPLILSTQQRRSKLRESWYFDCMCSRCQDPTEFGSNLAGILCSKCSKKSFLLPANPLNFDSVWLCVSEVCDNELTRDQIAQILDSLVERKDSLDRSDVHEFINFLHESENILHINHYILNSLRRWIVSLFCRTTKGNPDPEAITVSMLEAKVMIADKYLFVLNKIEPGLTRNRGRVLYEKADAQAKLANKKLEGGELDGLTFLELLQDSSRLAMEASKCLRYDPEGSFESFIRSSSNFLIQEIDQFQKFLLI